MTEPVDLLEIDDAKTFELLFDHTRVELLERLLEPTSVSELATAMDVPRTRLYHHIRLLEDAGLIRVVQTRQRGAIPEKIYQMTAKFIRPSARLIAQYPPRGAAAAMVDPILSTTRADVIRSAAEGRFDFNRPHDQPKRGMLARHLVSLSPERRDRFISDLQAVLERYDDDDPGGELVAAVLLVYPSSRSTA
jgi:DNA-binding transcriptional ArsR family regulator